MPKRPNVIFVTAHDLGRHLGCYGLGRVRTPCLDALAAGGARCTHAYCAAPICSPARAALVTGRYPHANGVLGLCHPPFGWELNAGEVHLATRLRRFGYETALAGLQHETSEPAKHGLEVSLNKNGAKAAAVAEACEAYLAGRAGRKAGDVPFYLQVGFFEPHRTKGSGFGPYEPEPQEHVAIPGWLADDAGSREEVARFQAAVLALDGAVGRIVAALDRHGLAHDTLIVFAADHGLPFPRAKASVYDPGLEIALIARWPGGGISRGGACDTLVAGVDVCPTILDLAGLPVPAEMHGRSVARGLRGEAVPDATVFAENNFHAYWDPIRAVRTRDRKLVVNFAATPAFYDTSQQWRPVTTPVIPADPRNAKHPLVELYDLGADPLEAHNLADDPGRSEERRGLLQALAAWMSRTDDFLLAAPPIEPRGRAARKLLREVAP